MRNILGSAVLAAVLLSVSSAFADAPATITIPQAHAALDEIARLVTKDYVFLEKREAIVAELRKRETAGRYDLTNAAQFAQIVSDDMVAISHDRHMWFSYDPDAYKALRLPKEDHDSKAYFEAGALRDNQGYAQMRILPGNIRYVELTGFEWTGAATTKVIADVARFLRGGDAIIFDISGNGGGDADAVKSIISYFMPPDGRLLMTFHDGLTGKSRTSNVINKLEGPRLTGIPLYVLISGSTGSAAEEFSYHIKNFKLGTLIGSKTAGAANNDDAFPVAPFFVQSISTGRPEHPVTHSNWEGVGVSPDIASPQDQALLLAQTLALKNLIATGPAAHRQEYEWALAGAKGKMHPVTLDAAALAGYAGQYGERKIWVADGGLAYQRQGRDATKLIPLGDDLFGFANSEDIRAHFRRVDGKVVGFDMLTSDGQSIPVNRGS